MSKTQSQRSAAQALVDQLVIHGVELAFCVPGESYLDVLDALYERRERIRLISARHEGGAAFMAEAYAKLTGKPGVCLVTRGPGASNAMNGMSTAFHDETPLILFIGQVARGFIGREAFQEIDFTRLFAPVSKWAVQIDDPRRIPELLARAFAIASSGRPGPVVIALPEDMQAEQVDVPDAPPYRPVQPAPSAAQIAAMHALLAQAERPLLIAGGGGWTTQATCDIRAFVQRHRIPAVASFRAQDIFDNGMPEYMGALGVGGNPLLNERLSQADVILAVGDRLSEMITQDYTLLRAPAPHQQLVHVLPEPSQLGRVYQPTLGVASGMAEFAAAALAMPAVDGARWADWLRVGRAAYERYIQPAPSHAPLDLGAVLAQMRARLPADAILTNGAGNYTAAVHRYMQFSTFRSQVAPVNGTMGYGVPAAVACKLAQPHRTVVSFAGDGCFLMHGQELATARQYGAPILVIVINDSRYGSIRAHQERRFPGRVIGTDLMNPDFVAYAHAFGAHSERVTHTEAFAQAFERALAAAAQRSALIELVVSTP
jgi:acetolactate synthase-1/2/3 large subunit